MTTIEMIVAMIIAILVLPHLCQMIRRPALLYCSYLLLGVVLGLFLKSDTRFMIEEIGRVGFILLLFLIGLEIELPPFGTLRKSFIFCLIWLGVQIPLFVLLSLACGFGWLLGFIAGTAINACSLGIAYSLMQSHKDEIDPISMKKILMSMVVIEICALFILAMSEVIYNHGGVHEVMIHGLALIGFILIIRMFSGTIHHQLSKLVHNAGSWRIHQLLLIIFAITMIGDRLGLSAPKTAFFLGLFMTATTGKGIKFEDELKPIAHNILIPMFFVSLGSKICIDHLFPYIFPTAVIATAILFAIRYSIFRWWSGLNVSHKYFLLFCPNLTMVAVAGGILMEHQVEMVAVNLLLAIGFLMTITSAALFPALKKEKVEEPILEQEIVPQAVTEM